MAEYVVVGGSKGIGRGIVQRLVDAGHAVTVLSRTPGESLSDLPRVKHHAIDLSTDELGAEILPKEIAGIAYCPGTLNLKSFRATKPEVFRSDFEVNVVGCVKVIQAALPGLKAAGKSSIVTFSTVAVAQGLPSHSTIAASKGAIEGLTRSLAAFFSSDEKITALGEKYALKRTGTVDDIANTAAFLLSDESSWITGQVIGVDGGMSTVR
jgi:NAD(P)-dependent dehydrogenase (short-subunit alcohol dehydrogenase family)